MLMMELDKILKRVEKNGIAIIPTDKKCSKLPKKHDVTIFRNRRMKQSVVIDSKKLKELLETDFL